MAIEFSPSLIENTIQQTETKNLSINFIESIPEVLPLCGTFMLVHHLLERPQSEKQIDFAAKILEISTTRQITIHPPSTTNPFQFMTTILQEAEVAASYQQTTPLGKSACRLKRSIDKLKTLTRFKEPIKDAVDDFCKCWQEFTRLVLQIKIDGLLA